MVDYWKKREQAWINRQYKADKIRTDKIQEYMESLQRNIEDEINRTWNRYASTEGITVTDARKRADKIDISESAKKAKKYSESKDFTPESNNFLKLYNAKMKINRLELLKFNISIEIENMYNEVQGWLEREMYKALEDEIKRQAGILGDSVRENGYSDIIEQVLNSSYHTDGFKFSDMLWKYQGYLKSDLDKLLIESISMGKNPKEIMKGLKKYLTDLGKANASYNLKRLVITETTRVQIAAQLKSYQKYNIKKYVFIAESRACNICKALDGKKFEVEKAMPGVNAPNMHPCCRCATAPDSIRKDWNESLKERGL